MANNASARKRIRQTKVRTERNRVLKSRIKTFRKKLSDAIEDGDKESIEKAYAQFSSAADVAAKKKVIHKNTAGRIKGRMAKKIAAVS